MGTEAHAKAAAERWCDHGYATDLHRQLAATVRSFLAEHGLTQSWLAESVGVTEKHVSMTLSGLADGSFDYWEKAAAAIGFSWVIRVDPRPKNGRSGSDG
jgi:hypothetical protein